MNKAQFVQTLAFGDRMTRVQAEAFLNTFLRIVKKTVKKGESVKIARFGRFGLARRKARESKNPQTGALMKVPSTRVPSFRPSRALKNACKI